ncbi:MAG: hypothetical protein ACYST6_15750 [Planctomycetota bacterium]|jgi:hypothetical protein
MKGRFWFIVGVIGVSLMCSVTGWAVEGGQAKGLKKSPILLTEICFWPLEGQAGWVEISNWGEEPVDVSGYSLSLGDGKVFVFPKDIEQVPPTGIVLVLCDGRKGQLADDRHFVGDNLARFHTQANLGTDANASDAVLPKRQGTCSLYAAGPMSEDTIIDFVCWGGSDPNLILRPNMLVTSEAVQGRVWRRSGFLMTTFPTEVRVMGGSPGVEKGGSISRRGLGHRWGTRAWDFCDPRDISPGANNRVPRPVLKHPLGCAHARSSKHSFTWFRKEDETYELQIASDRDFKESVQKVDVGHDFYVLDSLAPGKYYWRVRRQRGNMISEWSDVAHFRVNRSG